MRVIFLDMDGVMNSLRTCAAYEGYGFPPKEDGKGLMRSELKLDPIAVHLLRKLCERAGASIVVSSTWRKFTDIERFKKIFEAYGWPNAPVIDRTKEIAPGFRGTEVQEWLSRHPTVTHHVILDDDGDFHPGQPLVQTVHAEGLSFEDFKAALGILGVEKVWE